MDETILFLLFFNQFGVFIVIIISESLTKNALFYTDQTTPFSTALSAEGLGQDTLTNATWDWEPPIYPLVSEALEDPFTS